MGTVKTKIDLGPFCKLHYDYTRQRFDMTTPFVFRGWRYATDGKILVRVPCRAKDTDDNPRPTKYVEKICEPIAKAKKWYKLKRYPACKECKGKGESDGIDCDCRELFAEPDFGGVKISKHYCYLISRLPGAEWAEHDGGAILFRFYVPFGFGEGVVMGMRK